MSELLRVKKLRLGAVVPRRATAHASGLDLYACLEQGALEIGPEPTLVPTGIAIEFPFGLDVQVRPRSGLSRQGVVAPVGTIDSDYRGEVFVTMYVLPSLGSYTIHHGDRIAQLVVTRLGDISIVEVEETSETLRGKGGHGSTGA